MKYNTINITETADTILTEYNIGFRYLSFIGRHASGVFDMDTQELVSDEAIYSDYYEALFLNSEQSPIQLHLNNQSHLHENTIISYFSTMVFKDTGNIGFNLTTKTVAYSGKNKRAFIKSSDYSTIYIEKESGKPTVFKNKKFCYTNKALSSVFTQFRLLLVAKDMYGITATDFINKAFLEYFNNSDPKDCNSTVASVDSLVSGTVALYRIKRSNKFLKDLPWTQAQMSNLYNTHHLYPEELAKQREKILVQLRKGNTKKAVNLCFHGYDYPKSIKKILIRQGPLDYTKSRYEFLTHAVDKYGVDLVRSCLLAAPYAFECLLDCIDLGFSPKHVLNVAAVDHHILRDVLRLHGMVSERVQVTFNPNLRDYHDYLDHIYRTLNPRNRNFGVDYTEVFESVDTSKEYEEVSTDKYIFRSPKTANELILVGRDLNICVGSYRKHFFVKTLDIVLVTDLEDNYIGCIEINSNHVVQAKLKYNRKFSSNADVYSAMVAWMELMEVTPHTTDLGEGDFRYIPNMLPDKKRDNLLTEHLEKHRAANIEKADSMRANLVFIDETPFDNELTPF